MEENKVKIRIKQLISLAIVLIFTLSLFSEVTLAAPVDPRLAIESINLEEVSVGKSYELKIEIKNVGTSTASDIEYTLSSGASSSIQILNILPTIFEDYLYQGYTTKLIYQIGVDDMAEEGAYPLELNIRYYDTNDRENVINETINLSVVDRISKDNFDVELISADTIETGEEFVAAMSIKNTGLEVAKNITATLEGVNSNTITNIKTNEVTVSSISYNYDEVISFELYAYEDLQKGIYPMDVKLTYEDLDGREITEIDQIFFKVDMDSSSDEEVIIKSVTPSKEAVVPNSPFIITAQVTNEGSEVAKDVKVSISQDPAVIPITQSIVLLNSIDPGSIETVTFKMKATDSAITQNYPLEVTVEYGDEIITQYTGIYVSNDDNDNTSTPRIIIESFSVGQNKIFVGDEFELDLSIKNTSTVKNVKNLKLIMSSTEDANATTAFLPINQSNSFYVGYLDIDDSYDISIPFKVIANAEGKIYSLNVAFEYEDSDGNSYTDSETINIPVYQETEIAVSDVRIGKQFDSAYTLEVDFYNTGKVDISNMMVDIEGDFVTSNSNYYVGDFTTGRMDIYDVEIQGSVPNTIEGTIVFTYDDTFGEQVKYEKEFIVETVSGNMGGAGGIMGSTAREAMAQTEGMSKDEIRKAIQNGEMDQSQFNGMGKQVATEDSKNSLVFLIIGIVVLGIGITTFIIIKKRRKIR